MPVVAHIIRMVYGATLACGMTFAVHDQALLDYIVWRTHATYGKNCIS